jgi:tRNA-modifying protein YgfZ
MPNAYTILPDRAVLAITGTDARDFLQGLITNDIRKASPGKAVFAALLSPQGRFLHDFFITEHEDRLLLETDKARLLDLIKRLTLYKLRSRISIEALPQLQVSAIWGEESGQWSVISGQIIYADPRLPDLGMRFIASEVPASAGTTENDYDLHRLKLGIPEGSRDLIPERSLILEYGYDELNGVDFTKGCYVGQEVTARTHHRAQLRKFIHCVQSDTPLPPFATPILAGNREAGTMASSQGTLGLAFLRLEEVERAYAESAPLTTQGVPLQAKLPDWHAK